MAAVLVFVPRRLPVSPNDALVLLTSVELIVPSIPVCQASFTAATLPWGWSFKNSFTKLVLPGVSGAVLGFLAVASPWRLPWVLASPADCRLVPSAISSC